MNRQRLVCRTELTKKMVNKRKISPPVCRLFGVTGLFVLWHIVFSSWPMLLNFYTVA